MYQSRLPSPPVTAQTLASGQRTSTANPDADDSLATGADLPDLNCQSVVGRAISAARRSADRRATCWSSSSTQRDVNYRMPTGHGTEHD